MIVETSHGEFEINDITRKQRRDHYKKVKTIFAMDEKDPMKNEALHDLADEFTLIAFGDDKNAEEKLIGLNALQEDEVLTAIIVAYMGLEMGNPTGD